MPGLAAAIDAVEAAVREAVPTAEYLFIEPDVRRAGPEAAPAAPATPGPV
jgi:hypothetical protein